MFTNKKSLILVLALAGATMALADTPQGGKNMQAGRFALKMLSNSLPPKLMEAAGAKMRLMEDAQATDDSQVDSIVSQYGTNDSIKTCYTYYENGDVKTEVTYNWSTSASAYQLVSYTEYGAGGTTTPEYIEEGVFDEDGNKVPQSRREYDWTSYTMIDKYVDVVAWDHICKEQQYENDAWVTIRTNTATIDQNRLIKLECKELSGGDNPSLKLTDTYEYVYNTDGRLEEIKCSNVKKGDDGSLTYKISYDDQNRISRFGYEDGSWYIKYVYTGENDTAIYTYHKEDDGTDVCESVELSSTVKDVNSFTKDVTEWSKDADIKYNSEGKPSTGEVLLTASNADAIYIISYNVDQYDENLEEKAISEMTGMKMQIIGNEVNVETWKYADNAWNESVVVTTETTKLDDYTEKNVFTGDDGTVYGTVITYYHNPDSSAIISVRQDNANTKDDRIYDLLGRQVKSLSGGIRIVNGKKYLVR